MTAPHSASENGRTKTLAIVGLGLVLVAFVASRLMAGGGGGGTDAASQTPATAPSVTVAPVTPAPGTGNAGTTGTPAAPAAPTVETFEVFTTKNPFLALRTAAPTPAAGPAVVTPAPAAPAPAAPAPVASAPVAAAPTAAPTATVTAAPGVVTAAPTGVQASAPVRTTRVAVLDVFTEGDRVLANVRVNDTVSKVGAGDSFANNFKVVSLELDTRCGKFLYGDDQFRLCRGEELLK